MSGVLRVQTTGAMAATAPARSADREAVSTIPLAREELCRPLTSGRSRRSGRLSLSANPGRSRAISNETDIRLFPVDVPDEVIAHPGRRIAATPGRLRGARRRPAQGVQLATIQELVLLLDGAITIWRRCEARLNAPAGFHERDRLGGRRLLPCQVVERERVAARSSRTGLPGSVLEMLWVVGPFIYRTATRRLLPRTCVHLVALFDPRPTGFSAEPVRGLVERRARSAGTGRKPTPAASATTATSARAVTWALAHHRRDGPPGTGRGRAALI